jgi:lipopolysaccharide heptosyltransferase I
VKILLVRLGSLGDIVHALPVAAALRDRHPDAQIDWLVDARYATILGLVPAISRRVILGRYEGGRGGAPTVRDWLTTIAALRRERYDAAVDLQGLIKSALLARLSGARRVIGFGRSHLRERAAGVLYSETVDPGGAVHVVDKNLSALHAFGITDAPRRFPLVVGDLSGTGVSPVQAPAGVPPVAYALLNPGAAWPNKRWPAERFGAIAVWLHEAHGLRSLVLWGPGEERLASRIVACSEGAATQSPPTGIAEILALARGARLMLSGDTGPLHLAAAVGTPIVALFGPTMAERNGPWDPGDISLSRFDECVCHYQRRCRRDRPCIDDITLEDVRGAIDRRLAFVAKHA